MVVFLSKKVSEDASAFNKYTFKKIFIKFACFATAITFAGILYILLKEFNLKSIIISSLMVITCGALITFAYLKGRKKCNASMEGFLPSSIKMTFDKTKIVSEVVSPDGTEHKKNYQYIDIVKIKKDKSKIYCFTSLNSAIVLDENNIQKGNMEEFNKLLVANNVIKRDL